jgi:hypothetical protein
MINTEEDDAFEHLAREIERNKRQSYYFSPQAKWVSLTDEEISELVRTTHNTGSFVRAIETKLKEKNT